MLSLILPRQKSKQAPAAAQLHSNSNQRACAYLKSRFGAAQPRLPSRIAPPSFKSRLVPPCGYNPPITSRLSLTLIGECPGFQSWWAGSCVRACAVALTPHAASAFPGGLLRAASSCQARGVRRDGQNRDCLSGFGGPFRPGAEFQSLEEKAPSQAEPEETVEEAAQEARVAGGARGHQSPGAELREGEGRAWGGLALGGRRAEGSGDPTGGSPWPAVLLRRLCGASCCNDFPRMETY